MKLLRNIWITAYVNFSYDFEKWYMTQNDIRGFVFIPLIISSGFFYLPNLRLGKEYWADNFENIGEKFTHDGLQAA